MHATYQPSSNAHCGELLSQNAINHTVPSSRARGRVSLLIDYLIWPEYSIRRPRRTGNELQKPFSVLGKAGALQWG